MQALDSRLTAPLSGLREHSASRESFPRCMRRWHCICSAPPPSSGLRPHIFARVPPLESRGSPLTTVSPPMALPPMLRGRRIQTTTTSPRPTIDRGPPMGGMESSVKGGTRLRRAPHLLLRLRLAPPRLCHRCVGVRLASKVSPAVEGPTVTVVRYRRCRDSPPTAPPPCSPTSLPALVWRPRRGGPPQRHRQASSAAPALA